ncbi:hypothetical protein [Streptomyces sp. NPDC060184]|uniref:hypothetical protein n=1 Tax=Streptomyces sp. NPDC060184 TaxID=3347064 RepID=UPI00366A4E82
MTSVEVLKFADEQIVRSAQTLWPEAQIQLQQSAPSVTSHVRQVEVDGEILFAKCCILGVSLVSVLRGICGDWPAVQQAHTAYSRSPGALLRREMAQLTALRAAGLRVPRPAGYEGGVLFTQAVAGPTLAELVAREPLRTAELFERVFAELVPALRRAGSGRRMDSALIGERSVPGTFQRKFNGLSGPTYLERTGHGAVLAPVVSRLRTAKLLPAVPSLPLAFGDLKPEHVVATPRGFAFLDPGLQRDWSSADLAKLLSRTVLNLVSGSAPGDDARTTIAGISRHVFLTCNRLDADDRDVWLRHLILLWLMDTTNILTTYLSAPEGLPLPEHGRAMVERASVITQMLEHATASMASRGTAATWWRTCLDDAAWAVSA